MGDLFINSSYYGASLTTSWCRWGAGCKPGQWFVAVQQPFPSVYFDSHSYHHCVVDDFGSLVQVQP